MEAATGRRIWGGLRSHRNTAVGLVFLYTVRKLAKVDRNEVATYTYSVRCYCSACRVELPVTVENESRITYDNKLHSNAFILEPYKKI